MKEEQKIANMVGHHIRKRRKELGLSQEELAIRMGLKHKASICKAERGTNNMTILLLKRYAAALSTTVTNLVEGL